MSQRTIATKNGNGRIPTTTSQKLTETVEPILTKPYLEIGSNSISSICCGFVVANKSNQWSLSLFEPMTKTNGASPLETPPQISRPEMVIRANRSIPFATATLFCILFSSLSCAVMHVDISFVFFSYCS